MTTEKTIDSTDALHPEETALRLPLIPLRDVVIFPHMVYPLLIGRQFTINALQEGMSLDKQVFLCAQRKPEVDKPERADLHDVGVVARVLQVMKLPNGAVKALMEGLYRAKLDTVTLTNTFYAARVEPIMSHAESATPEMEALTRNVSESFAEYVRLNRRIPEEVTLTVGGITDPDHLADAISSHILAKLEVKQGLLAVEAPTARLGELTTLLRSEIEILKLERKIDGNVRESLSKNQRDFYLQQQLKAIREELGQDEESVSDLDELFEKLEKLDAPQYVKDRADEELRKLGKMHPFSAEAAVVRGYLDWIFDLPWTTVTTDRESFVEVERILNEDHYGLDKAKRRIIEHLAVLKISQSARGPILCFVGPPGVGKTSVGKSIARALDRKFVRISLGGVHDEAEIRGHRKTYIGSLPGRIIQGMKKAGSRNPVFLLDEVDKVGSDFRGDPAAALLEALDPEQNIAFSDNYLELDFNLSQTLFITTANSTSNIPRPLLDRMELIRLPGYSSYEKINIVREYILPKLIKEFGLGAQDISIPDDLLEFVIRHYTHEAGVRDAERQVATLLRQVATAVAKAPAQVGRVRKRTRFHFTVAEIRKVLGAEKFTNADVKVTPGPGYVVGLAWTESGGEALPVEVSVVPGKAKLTLTGKLGDVMKESATAGLTYIRSHAKRFGLAPNFLDTLEIHVHIPEGAVPKDGPSAGITITTAILSALTGVAARGLVGMTGEVTLTGDVLPIGGLNEKLLAAKRSGLTTVILPERNRKDLAELRPEVTSGLTLKFVTSVEQVFRHAFANGAPKLKTKTTSSPSGSQAESGAVARPAVSIKEGAPRPAGPANPRARARSRSRGGTARLIGR